MPRNLTVFLPMDTDTAVSAICEDPQWWLPAPAAAVPGGWIVSLQAVRVAHWVVCRVGPSSATSPAGLWRSLSWEPSDGAGRVRSVDRFLPRFDGEVGIVQTPGPTLILSGWYEPPGAVVGSLADRAGLERVAESTARRFVAEIAKRLGAGDTAERETPLALR